jgi:hypothetical protein
MPGRGARDGRAPVAGGRRRARLRRLRRDRRLPEPLGGARLRGRAGAPDLLAAHRAPPRGAAGGRRRELGRARAARPARVAGLGRPRAAAAPGRALRELPAPRPRARAPLALRPGDAPRAAPAVLERVSLADLLGDELLCGGLRRGRLPGAAREHAAVLRARGRSRGVRDLRAGQRLRGAPTRPRGAGRLPLARAPAHLARVRRRARRRLPRRLRAAAADLERARQPREPGGRRPRRGLRPELPGLCGRVLAAGAVARRGGGAPGEPGRAPRARCAAPQPRARGAAALPARERGAERAGARAAGRRRSAPPGPLPVLRVCLPGRELSRVGRGARRDALRAGLRRGRARRLARLREPLPRALPRRDAGPVAAARRGARALVDDRRRGSLLPALRVGQPCTAHGLRARGAARPAGLGRGARGRAGRGGPARAGPGGALPPGDPPPRRGRAPGRRLGARGRDRPRPAGLPRAASPGADARLPGAQRAPHRAGGGRPAAGARARPVGLPPARRGRSAPTGRLPSGHPRAAPRGGVAHLSRRRPRRPTPRGAPRRSGARIPPFKAGNRRSESLRA